MITREELAEIEKVMEELEIDEAARKQAVEIAIDLARLQESKIFFANVGRCLTQNDRGIDPIPTNGTQGGLDRSQHEPHKLTEVGSTPTPATTVPVAANPNAACFDQVHVYPKGRWT